MLYCIFIDSKAILHFSFQQKVDYFTSIYVYWVTYQISEKILPYVSSYKTVCANLLSSIINDIHKNWEYI